MRVSVIIPNYNHAQYLDERLRSVLNQTYQDFEVIILDDCSTDDSKAVIEKYRGNEHISQIVYNEQNSGSTFKQWDKGLSLAKADIVWIAESDDSCDTRFLEKLVPLHIKENNVITFARSQRMDENGNLLETFHNEIMSGSWQGKDFLEAFLGRYNIVMNASSAIFDKKVALSIDPQYKTFKGSGDWLFWIEMAEKGSVSFVGEALNYFRKHGENSTEKFYSNGVDFTEDKRIFDYLTSHNLISPNTAKMIRRGNLSLFKEYPFDSEEVRERVLECWDFTPKERMRYKLANLFHKLV